MLTFRRSLTGVARHPRTRAPMLLVGGLSLMTFVGSGALGAGAAAQAAGATPKQLAAHVTFTPSPSPAYAADAADPNVLYSGGTYYAFTTGTPAGNFIQALTDTTGSPASGWHPYTGGSGSSALPSPPSWETPNTQTSPGVFNYGGHWVMFYDASVNPYPNDSGHSCISVATAATLSPPVFSDTSAGPLYCSARRRGVLDPSPFVDPATGAAYLLWKSNDGGGSAAPSQIWSAQLSADGTSIVGTPTVLLTVDQPLLPWETTTDDPQMVVRVGHVPPAVLRRRLHHLELQRGAHHVLRPPRPVQPAGGTVPHDLRHRLRARWRRTLPGRPRELVARLRGLVVALHLLQLRRGAGSCTPRRSI